MEDHEIYLSTHGYREAFVSMDDDIRQSDGSTRGLMIASEVFLIRCIIIWTKKWGKWRWINPFSLWELKRITGAYSSMKNCWDRWVSAAEENIRAEA